MRRDYSDPDDRPARNDWQTVKTLFPYLWPQGEPGLRWRVVVAVIFLAAAKGTKLDLECKGDDEQEALDAICDLINRRFDEGE